MIDCLTETKTVEEHFTEMKNSVEKLFTTLKTFLRKQLSLYGWKKEFPILLPMPSEGENWKFFKVQNFIAKSKNKNFDLLRVFHSCFGLTLYFTNNRNFICTLFQESIPEIQKRYMPESFGSLL